MTVTLGSLSPWQTLDKLNLIEFNWARNDSWLGRVQSQTHSEKPTWLDNIHGQIKVGGAQKTEVRFWDSSVVKAWPYLPWPWFEGSVPTSHWSLAATIGWDSVICHKGKFLSRVLSLFTEWLRIQLVTQGLGICQCRELLRTKRKPRPKTFTTWTGLEWVDGDFGVVWFVACIDCVVCENMWGYDTLWHLVQLKLDSFAPACMATFEALFLPSFLVPWCCFQLI